MKVAIMQPYFFPYIGYFQLINSVDKFVIYDDIQYTKKGWINRNRVLQNGKDCYISLPLKKASNYLDVRDKYLADTWPKDRIKLLNKLSNCYRKAPYFHEVFPTIESIIQSNKNNLFDYLYHSIKELMDYLNITTEIVVSSSLNVDRTYKAEQKVIAICKEMNATHYINPIGGTELYSKYIFNQALINLQFLKSNNIIYSQFNSEFIPWLSIIDVIMFNSSSKVNELLSLEYGLIQ